MENWYVAHSKPRCEELLWKQFCLRSFESYYPIIKVQTVNPRARQTQPYFPGYVFVHVDLAVTGRTILERLPGGVGLVSFDDEPAIVPDGLIESLKERIERLKAAPTPCLLHKGDAVIIHNGVFAGYEGIFDFQLSGQDRVRILLSLLDHRLMTVEIPASYIHLINQN
jgi:transcriptional antiterminator RfaH